MKRHGQKHPIAIPHVANKTLRIMWAMLHTRTPYMTHSPTLYKTKLGRISAKKPAPLYSNRTLPHVSARIPRVSYISDHGKTGTDLNEQGNTANNDRAIQHG